MIDATSGLSAGLTTSRIAFASEAPAVLIVDSVRSDPIKVSASAVAVLPDPVDIVLYDRPSVSGIGGFKIIGASMGSIRFDLTKGYSMLVDERESEVVVMHEDTSERIRVWGAAQIELGQAVSARFWGTTTVVLGNGAKITLETKPDVAAATIPDVAAAATIPDVAAATKSDVAAAETFRLDRLTVTLDERAMVISGASQDKLGDMKIVQSNAGDDVDESTRDGLVVARDPASEWADDYGAAVTQATFDATAIGAAFGPGSTMLSLGEFQSLLSRFLSWGQASAMFATMSYNRSNDITRQDPNDIARTAAIHRAWIRHADEAAAVMRDQIRTAAAQA